MVNFDFEDRPYDVDEKVLFDGSLTEDLEGDELTFKWFFGDGGKSTDINPGHTYREPGAYTA
ncbi:MAG: cytochrome c, partial [Bacillariaceae sp.]